jgi:glycosyltransferase involved in cell wall biosynthesis
LLDLIGAGVTVPPEDAEALANAVVALDANPRGAAEMGARGREFARKRMRNVQAERLEQVLLDVTAP